MSKHWSQVVTLEDSDREGVLPTRSVRQSQEAHQGRSGMAQPKQAVLNDFIFGGERKSCPKYKSIISKIGT